MVGLEEGLSHRDQNLRRRFNGLAGLTEAKSSKLYKRVKAIQAHATAASAAIRAIRDEFAKPNAYEKKPFQKAGTAAANNPSMPQSQALSPLPGYGIALPDANGPTW